MQTSILFHKYVEILFDISYETEYGKKLKQLCQNLIQIDTYI